MRHYLVEAYDPGRDRVAAAAHGAARGAVRHRRTVTVPADEITLHFFDAPDEDALRAVLRDAALAYYRIVEALDECAT